VLERSAYNILLGKSERMISLGDLGNDGKIILI
jgi:hypothetical protein